MPQQDDLELLIRHYPRLTPAEYTRLHECVVERGKVLRTEFLRAMFRRILSWHRHRSAVAQLRALDDAVLKDIGISRGSIEAAVLTGRRIRC